MATFYYVLIAIVVLALIFSAILGFASVKLKVEADPIVEKIDAILPQSQCGQCGYPGCKPYAEAIANGDVITKCIPGGSSTVIKIAELLGVEPPENCISRMRICLFPRSTAVSVSAWKMTCCAPRTAM